ncbi:MAG: hypothetical protein KME30_18705 [Iphinoe sp. HA4291-MV1]|nr:hypothetical protein [Iphinoe sp. HA4291-MV1]
MTEIKSQEGFVSFRSYKVWYRLAKPLQQEPGKLPLLCLHGGPGVPQYN